MRLLREGIMPLYCSRPTVELRPVYGRGITITAHVAQCTAASKVDIAEHERFHRRRQGYPVVCFKNSLGIPRSANA